MNSTLNAQSDLRKERRICCLGDKQAFIVLILVFLILYSLLVATYLRPRNSIENLDFWSHIRLGYRPNWSQLGTFVDGFYPIGYPLLLRLAIDNDIDALRFGQFLSWAGGAVALFSLFQIACHITHKPPLALASVFLLLTNVEFFRYVTYEGTDMLSAGLQILSADLIWLAEIKNSSVKSKLLIGLAGCVLGLAYLVRYTSLILLPIILLYILWKTGKPLRNSAQNIGLLLAGFLGVAFVQIIPSIIVYGSPFYNLQAKNIWFGLYGQGDWVNNWAKVPDTISLLEVILIDPAFFLKHWTQQILSAFSPYRFWPSILHWAWLLGGATLIFDTRMHPANRFLVILTLVSPIPATSTAWISSRFLLVTIFMQSLLITLLVAQIASSLVPKRRLFHYFIVPVLLISTTLGLQMNSLIQRFESPVRVQPQQVNDFLRTVGMQNPSRVVTNDPFLHATDIPARTRYAQAYAFASHPSGIDELLSQPSASDWRYFVFNYENGFGDYNAVKNSAPAAKSQLVPLQLDDSAAVFCAAPCLFDDMRTDNILFDNGMELIGHKFRSGKVGVSLYLYWQTNRPLTLSYKVSVRVQDTDGNILQQIDNVPQLWTYPTTSWPLGTPVADFYYFEPGFSIPNDSQIALVVYEEQSLKNSQAKDQLGRELGVVVLLQP